MTDITQPEALRLADELLIAQPEDLLETELVEDAAAELRRLQAMTEDQAKALSVTEYVFSERNRLEAQRDELLAALKDATHALEDDGRHYAAGVARAAIAKATGGKHTTDRELMQQALEGLEAAYEGQIWLSHLPDLSTALRERLAQPEQSAWNPNDHYNDGFRDGFIAAHPEQKPVAHTLNCICGAVWGVSPDGFKEMVHAPKPPQRQWVGSGDLENSNAYLTTTQRTWVELTDADIDQVSRSVSDVGYAYERALLAKFKEKNT